MLALLLGLFATGNVFAGSAATFQGRLADGSAYLIEVPSGWNGSLLVYSHGYVTPGNPRIATDAGDPEAREWLLGNGFAVAGTSYASTGWAVEDAFRDQLDLLDLFTRLQDRPRRTIAWGSSMGGLVAVGLLQRHPDRFDAGLSLCGTVAGTVASRNQMLDQAFVFATLLGPASRLRVVGITDPDTNLTTARALLDQAQATPSGRARLALVAAMGDTPGWYDRGSPEPRVDDLAIRETSQYRWLREVEFPAFFFQRAELERRAHGNPSWNTGVDYELQLQKSSLRDEVLTFYRAAGLDLGADLEALRQAPRIAADPGAVDYAHRFYTPGSSLGGRPLLTVHTTDDGLVVAGQEQALATKTGSPELLKQLFVHRPGHCAFTGSEAVASIRTMIDRLDTGRWHEPVGFYPFRPVPFLRP
jgi:pimeloyl-ACP methyl ester carboxylesterase